MVRKMIILLVFISVLSVVNQLHLSIAHAQKPFDNTVELYDNTEQIKLDHHIEILVETDERITLDKVVEGKYDDKFKPYTGKSRPNLGYHRTYYWVRFHVENKSMIDNWLLEIDAPKLNHVILYSYNKEKQRYETDLMGNLYEFTNRKVQHRNFVTPIHLNVNE